MPLVLFNFQLPRDRFLPGQKRTSPECLLFYPHTHLASLDVTLYRWDRLYCKDSVGLILSCNRPASDPAARHLRSPQRVPPQNILHRHSCCDVHLAEVSHGCVVTCGMGIMYPRATIGTRRVRKRYQYGTINICKSRLEVHLANTF